MNFKRKKVLQVNQKLQVQESYDESMLIEQYRSPRKVKKRVDSLLTTLRNSSRQRHQTESLETTQRYTKEPTTFRLPDATTPTDRSSKNMIMLNSDLTDLISNRKEERQDRQVLPQTNFNLDFQSKTNTHRQLFPQTIVAK